MLDLMDKKIADSFAWVEWMIEQRERLGWSQADLASEAGLTRTTISDYEKRQRPNPEIKALVRISVALGFSPYRLPQIAGLIPVEDSPDEEIEKIMYAAAKMNKQDQAEVLAFIRMKNNLRKNQGK